MPYSKELKVYWFLPIRAAARSCMAICNFFKFEDSYIHDIGNPRDLEYDFFSNVRNPYSRLLSIYELYCHHKNEKPNDFVSWVKSNSDKTPYQIDLNDIFIKHGRFPNKFIRVEHLFKDLYSIEFIRNEKSDKFEKIIDENVINNRFRSEVFSNPWQSYYDEELANYVYNSLEKDFLLFGYDKNSWKDGTS